MNNEQDKWCSGKYRNFHELVVVTGGKEGECGVDTSSVQMGSMEGRLQGILSIFIAQKAYLDGVEAISPRGTVQGMFGVDKA